MTLLTYTFSKDFFPLTNPGVSSLGVPGVPWHPQILADQLTLSQPRGEDYAHHIILAPPDFQTFRRPCNHGKLSIFVHKPEYRNYGNFFDCNYLILSLLNILWKTRLKCQLVLSCRKSRKFNFCKHRATSLGLRLLQNCSAPKMAGKGDSRDEFKLEFFGSI